MFSQCVSSHNGLFFGGGRLADWMWVIHRSHLSIGTNGLNQKFTSFSGTLFIRPRKISRGFSALIFLKYLGQFLNALAISGHSERFSPGQNGPEVGGPEGLWLTTGPPTLGPFWPGENLSEWPEIARALRNWPKFFKNHRAENSRKISRGLIQNLCVYWSIFSLQ